MEGASKQILSEMIAKAISKIGMGKAAGPSGTVAEMLKPLGDSGVALIRDLVVEVIIKEGRIPSSLSVKCRKNIKLQKSPFI